MIYRRWGCWSHADGSVTRKAALCLFAHLFLLTSANLSRAFSSFSFTASCPPFTALSLYIYCIILSSTHSMCIWKSHHVRFPFIHPPASPPPFALECHFVAGSLILAQSCICHPCVGLFVLPLFSISLMDGLTIVALQLFHTVKIQMAHLTKVCAHLKAHTHTSACAQAYTPNTHTRAHTRPYTSTSPFCFHVCLFSNPLHMKDTWHLSLFSLSLPPSLISVSRHLSIITPCPGPPHLFSFFPPSKLHSHLSLLINPLSMSTEASSPFRLRALFFSFVTGSLLNVLSELYFLGG